MTASSKMNMALRRGLLRRGQAMPPKQDGGQPRFPINDAEDVKKAVGLVGQVPKREKPAVRRFIIRNARKPHIQGMHHVPDNWKADGSLRDDPDGDGDSAENDTDNDGM